MEKWEHLRIPLADITRATNGFQKEIGRGGYGSVYEGELTFKGKLMKIAVKKLNEKHGQGLKEFLTEIDLLSGQQHENIITLIGYCDEGKEKIIVYEHAEHGSLDRYIRCNNTTGYTLTWLKRLKIVVDAARGLDHLHYHLHNNQVIIHRDIKSSNILLDHNWAAKISDLGLSKSTFSGYARTTVISHACGTSGYVEPEYIHYGSVSRKSDVYSFGMVLFEVLCGRLCTIRGSDGIMLLADVIKEHYKEDKLDKLIDPSLRTQMSQVVLRRYSTIAYKCLLGRKDRPSMDDVKKELEEMLKLPMQDQELQRIRSVWRSSEENITFDEHFKKLTVFSLDEIEHATSRFELHNVLGNDVFGRVYSANISGRKVAIKHIHKEKGNQKGNQLYSWFLNEISLLSLCDHVNIISLLGYCDEGDERILVYEYMSNGSLLEYLYIGGNLEDIFRHVTLEKRLEISIGVAKGLSFLHSGTHFSITHGHILLKNILLDDNLVPKISSFKSSRGHLVGPSVSEIITNTIEGTKLRQKADVHAFGRVLLEVLWLGIPPDEGNPNWLEYDYTKTIISLECLHECENLIQRCLEKDSNEHPVIMSEVVERLELALKLQMSRYILIPPFIPQDPEDPEDPEEPEEPQKPKNIFKWFVNVFKIFNCQMVL